MTMMHSCLYVRLFPVRFHLLLLSPEFFIYFWCQTLNVSVTSDFCMSVYLFIWREFVYTSKLRLLNSEECNKLQDLHTNKFVSLKQQSTTRMYWTSELPDIFINAPCEILLAQRISFIIPTGLKFRLIIQEHDSSIDLCSICDDCVARKSPLICSSL